MAITSVTARFLEVYASEYGIASIYELGEIGGKFYGKGNNKF
jgi:hypothetical protein